MPHYICKACGIQRPKTVAPPALCPVCDDPRQFVPASGQAWMTPDALVAEHGNIFRYVAPGVMTIRPEPRVGIGQRAFLLRTPSGNVLWDCVTLLDAATEDIINALGGLAAVTISHPHVYSAMARWGRVFDCPVLVHARDREWVPEADPPVEFWEEDIREVLPGLDLHRMGGHFPGSAVLHWRDRRRLFTGDTVLVTADRRHVTFQWSFPNDVPLPADTVRRMAARFDRLDFDALHSSFDGRDIPEDAREAVARSAARHIDPPRYD